MANTSRVPPVPQSVKDPIQKQFLERLRKAIVEVSSAGSSISGGGPPYVSIAGDTMTGALTLSNLAGNGDQIIAIDSSGELKISGRVASDITNNTFNIATNTADIATNSSLITGLQTISGDHETRIGTLEAIDHTIYTTTSTLSSISGDLQLQISNNDAQISGLVSISGDHETRIDALEATDYSIYATTSTLATISGDLQLQISNNDAQIAGLVSISGDHESRIDTLEATDYSIYATTSTLSSISGDLQAQITSNDVQIAGLVSISGDLQLQISNNDAQISGLVSISGDHETRIDTLEAIDHSVYATTSTLSSISGDLQAQITSNDAQIAGLVSISGDHETRIGTLETYTSGITGGITQLNDAYVNVTGDTMTGDLIMSANILPSTSQTYNLGSTTNTFEQAHLNEVHLVPLSGAEVPAYEEGLLFYDGDKRVLKMYNDIPDVSLDIGEENWVRVVNKTGSQIDNGKVVYINGAQGNRPTVTLANSSSEITSANVIGMATHDISNNQEGFITTFGLVRDLNTASFNVGDPLYLSTSGNVTNVKPSYPNHLVVVGFCVVSHANQGIILVNVSNGFELEELHNINITSVNDRELLTYSQSLSAWLNTSVSNAISGDLDYRYVNLTGDTMTGPLVVNSDFTTNAFKYLDADTLSSDSLFIGPNVGASNLNSTIGIGLNALSNAGSSTNETVAIGENAGLNVNSRFNVFIGFESGKGNASGMTGGYNFCMGPQTGASLTSGSNNVFLGNTAGASVSTGVGNVLIGNNTGSSITTSPRNTLIGNGAGVALVSGLENTAIGAGALAATSTGSYNIAIGRGAFQTGNVSTSVALGYQAGQVNAGTANIFLGYQAGKSATGSNQLWIENSSSSSPLIYGEFDNDLVKINGDHEVTGYHRGSALDYSIHTTDYTTLSTDGGKVIYLSGGPMVVLNQSPIDGEHIWLSNDDSTLSSLISGGINTIQGETTQNLPKLSTYHLHYKNSNWRVL